MLAIWLINWQTVKISVSCTIFVLPSTYPHPNIPHKLLSTIHIISQNCRTSHLKPLTVNAIQTVTQSVQSVSARLLIYCELLCRQRGTKNTVSLLSWTFVCAHQTHSVNTEHSEAQYRYAPHNDVSVNDGPHIRRWPHNIIIFTNVLHLPKVFSTVTSCMVL